MAQYIDADKLWNDRPLIPEGKSQEYMAGFSECMWSFSKRIREQIDNPTADVVPKSEVEKIFEEIEKIACIYKLDGDFYLDNFLYTELKKKYMEVKNDR